MTKLTKQPRSVTVETRFPAGPVPSGNLGVAMDCASYVHINPEAICSFSLGPGSKLERDIPSGARTAGD